MMEQLLNGTLKPTMGGESGSSVAIANFLMELDAHPDANAMAQNNRVAAVMYHDARLLPPQLLDCIATSSRCRKSFIPTFLLQVARRYKSLNGAEQCKPHKICQLHSSSARALLFLQRLGNLSRGPDLDALDNAVKDLVYGFGILTDQAQWVVASEPPAGHCALRKLPPRLLIAPVNRTTNTLQRYQMSRSQLALFRYNYGFDIAQPADGDGFEVASTQFLEFALLGASGCKMQELLEVLGADPMLEAVKLLGALELTHTRVRVLQASLRIEPGKVLGLSAEESPMAHEVLVIRNAPKASFADLIVIFPRMGVLLIQNKFYFKTKFTYPAAIEELQKMGSDVVNENGLVKAAMDSVAAPMHDLHENLRSVAACGEDHPNIWVRFCLMTTKERIHNLPQEVLQFHATKDTLFPIALPQRAVTNFVEVSRFDTADPNAM
jgi:hypothetical protein